MKDTYYFQHDYNTRNDFKIKKLLAKHGYMGYGLFWAIIEDLYNNTNVLQTNYDSIAYDLRTTSDIIKSIINDFDLFIIDGDNFGSLSVERRLNARNEKSRKAREAVLSRWAKTKDNTDVLQTNYDSNTRKERKGKEKKGKESKVNEIETPPPIPKVNPKKENDIKEKAPEHSLQVFIKENCLNVIKLKQQLNFEEAEKLLKDFKEFEVKEILIAMDNFKPLITKYLSVYRTCLNWLKLRKEKGQIFDSNKILSNIIPDRTKIQL